MEDTGNSDKLSLEWPADQNYSKSSSVAHSEGQKRTPTTSGWPGVKVHDSTLKTKNWAPLTVNTSVK